MPRECVRPDIGSSCHPEEGSRFHHSAANGSKTMPFKATPNGAMVRAVVVAAIRGFAGTLKEFR
jgi:hypothetical protein